MRTRRQSRLMPVDPTYERERTGVGLLICSDTLLPDQVEGLLGIKTTRTFRRSRNDEEWKHG
jgi:hypothetical protein